MLQSYRPTNRVTVSGLLFLSVAILGGGLILGGLASALSRIVWLIFVFPIGLGLIAGMILGFVIVAQKIRFPALAFLAGIVMGVVIFGAFQYGHYSAFQGDMRQEMDIQDDVDTQNKAIDIALKIETGYSGFFGYMKFMAQEGVSIGKLGRSNKITLNEPLTWAYWLIELSLIGGAAALTAREAAKQPFCEACQQWYNSGELVGNVPNEQGQQFLTYVKGGDFPQASALVIKDSKSFPSLEVYLRPCQHPAEHSSVFEVRQASVDAKGKVERKDILTGVVSAYEASEITRGITQQQPIAS